MLVFRGVKISLWHELSAWERVGKLWRKTGLLRLVALGLSLQGCGGGLPTFVPLNGPASDRVSGYIVSDSPQATLIGSYALEDGGTAADAVVAASFALTVSLPSRAGLGGGGACLYYDATTSNAFVYEFLPDPPVITGQPPRFTTAVPGTVRGLFALHTEFGRLPWNANLVRAEAAARFGDKVSRSLATDLANSSEALVNDRAALDRFMTNRRQFLQEGDAIRQVDLAGLLGRIRSGQAGAFYTGGLARLMSDQALVAGGVLSTADLNGYRVQVSQVAEADEGYLESLSVGAGDASTSLSTLDTFGNAAACILTMGRPFGAGLMIEDFGMLLSVPPGQGAQQDVRIRTEGDAGVKSVQAGMTDEEGASGHRITCDAGVRSTPERCVMTVRPQLSGFAVQAGERR